MPLQVLIPGQPITSPGRPPTSRGDVNVVEESRATEPTHPRDAPDAARRDRGGGKGGHARAGVADYRETSADEEEAAELLRAVDIMSGRPFTLTPDTAVGAVREAFRQYRYRHIPITDSTQVLQGIISDRDLWPLGGVDDQPVSRHMVSRVVAASPETTVHEIARALLDYKIGAMPVTDSNRRLVGLITRTDVLRTMIRQGGVHVEA